MAAERIGKCGHGYGRSSARSQGQTARYAERENPCVEAFDGVDLDFDRHSHAVQVRRQAERRDLVSFATAAYLLSPLAEAEFNIPGRL